MDIMHATVSLVSNLIQHRGLDLIDVPDALTKIAAGLRAAAEEKPPEPIAVPAVAAVPAVPIKKSITPDYLVSLEDGRRYKSLKRHLSGRGLTPEGYRAKYGLPADYPMVSPNYAKQRSELAKTMGLGRRSELAKAA